MTQKRKVRAGILLRAVEVVWGIGRGSLDTGMIAGRKPSMARRGD
jgi:hypothetical protein